MEPADSGMRYSRVAATVRWDADHDSLFNLLGVVMTKLLRSLLLVPVVSLFLVGCAEDQNPVDQGSMSDVTSAESLGKKGGSPKPEAGTILDVAKNDPNFSILVAAVQFAGLESALSGKRQLTVLAPTNDGFVRLLGKARSYA